MFTINNLRKGDRVELHPATAFWHRGGRFGTIVGIGRKFLTVDIDRLGHRVRVGPENIFALVKPASTPGS